jgi:hypothetical protein
LENVAVTRPSRPCWMPQMVELPAFVPHRARPGRQVIG